MVWPRTTKDIHKDLVYHNNGNDLTNYFRSEVVAKNGDNADSDDLEAHFLRAL